jgi:ectoine hydroxylase-related dioxygenase (phytanoyl-CoA dioxygenase family)
MSSVLGSRRQRFWSENGYLVLPGFFTEEETETVASASDRMWAARPDDVVVDDLVTNRRCRIREVSDDEHLGHRFKLNDLYLADTGLRQVALSQRVGMVLEELLGDEPVLCNTLNFDYGSQQADHLDTLYMTPLTDLALVATWMALEDTRPEAGPLRYFPGSNHIVPYRFSTGSYHVNLPEMERWADYMADQVDRQGLEEQRFAAKRGDLFIWHANLLHGGSEICQPGLTRRSLVTHFFTQSDCEVLGSDLRPAAGGWWMNKPPLEVPPDSPPLLPDSPPSASAPDGGILPAGREPRARMESLLTALD